MPASIARHAAVFALLLGGFACLSGCSQSDPQPEMFEPNMVHAMKYQIKDGVSYDQALADADWVTGQMFGSPDHPLLPNVLTEDDSYADLMSIDRLQQAAGPIPAPSDSGNSDSEDSDSADTASNSGGNSKGHGLYRQHCATCHGITGNGRGVTAAILNPYPRDYRMGLFKFKSTIRSAKPTRDDLIRVIADGIPGTAMKKIPELKDEDIQALTDYVIYLSMRGELERSLIDYASQELDLESGDRVLDVQLYTWIKSETAKRNSSDKEPETFEPAEFKPEDLVIDNETIDEDVFDDFRDIKDDAHWSVAGQSVADELKDLKSLVNVYESRFKKPASGDDKDGDEDDESEGDDEPTSFSDRADEMLEQIDYALESWEAAQDEVLDTADAWMEAEDEIVEVPQPPADIPVADSHEEFVAIQKGDQADALAKSIQRGQQLFVGKIASCSKCHGEKGLGDGTTNDYDDWTKDWTLRVGIKPEDHEQLIPLLARGALPPLHAKPRNFAEGVFRGGSTAADLYRRIVAGIAGSPMPAATFVPGQFEQDDVWHLINFVRSLQVAPTDQPTTEEKPSTGQPEPQQTAAK